jgi:hypothetical protein
LVVDKICAGKAHTFLGKDGGERAVVLKQFASDMEWLKNEDLKYSR